MKLYPAMDLYNQAVVRLEQGDFKRLTTYPKDPLSTALAFEKDGAEGLHIIDLQAAQTGTLFHRELIVSLAQHCTIPIQVGGGIRSYETASAYLDGGVAKVIVGTMAFQNPEQFQRLVKDYPGRIIVALDVWDETIRVHGWQETSDVTVGSVVKDFEALGVKDILVTDIATDGMLQGPNLTLYQTLQAQTSLNIIASGGIGGCEDIQKLAQAHLHAAVFGKALYENKITLKEALVCSRVASSLV